MAWSSRPLRVAALGLALLLALPGTAPADPAARQVVEEFHRNLVMLAGRTFADVEARAAALRPLVTGSHDLSYIARFTVRRQWPDLSDAQRVEFVAAFTDLSVMTYATRFESVTAESFSIRGSRSASRGRVQIEAAIHPSDAEPIPLDYLLHRSASGWQIINIIADGVSDLALKRAEYQQVLAEQSFAGLLAHLRQQTAALREP